MLGADHHGYIARLKAAAAALGDDPATVEVLIGQMVNLVRDGQPVRMSKRAGTVITLDDLVDAIGVDAARYVADPVARSTRPIDIDLALWSSARPAKTRSTTCNTRTPGLSALARNAAELGLHRRHRAPRAAHPREGGHADPQPRRVPARAENRCVAAGTAPGVPLPRGPGRRLPPVLRLLPGAAAGRRGSPATCTPRAWRCARPPARSSPTAWRSSASPHRSGCERTSRRPAARRGDPPRRCPAAAADRRPRC